MPILDVAVTSLVPLAALAIVVGLVVRARRSPPDRAAGDWSDRVPPDARRKLGCIQVVVGIMLFGLIVQATVLAYWRWRMPD